MSAAESGAVPPEEKRHLGRERWRTSRTDIALGILTVLLYIYLYLPVLVIVVLAFNDSELTALPLRGFTLRWFESLFQDAHLMRGLLNSIVIGILTVLVSVPLGLMLAYTMVRMVRRGSGLLTTAVVLPMLTPRIILAVLLLVFFTSLGIRLSLGTVLLGHVVLVLPFTTLIISARLRGLDPALEEAAHDLGASKFRIWWEILLPLLWPAVLAASLIAFTVSFDEMVVTFFTTGFESTLPVVIWSMVLHGYTQEINAVGAVIIAVTLVLIAVALRLRGDPRLEV